MIQKIKLTPGRLLTKTNIQDSLQKARSGYDYCRFDLKFGNYITVAYFKDGTFDVMTNIRNLGLWNEIQNAKRSSGIGYLSDYIFNWIRQFNG